MQDACHARATMRRMFKQLCDRRPSGAEVQTERQDQRTLVALSAACDLRNPAVIAADSLAKQISGSVRS